MFTNGHVKLVAEELMVLTHIVMAAMFDFEAKDEKFAIADVIAAVMNWESESDDEELPFWVRHRTDGESSYAHSPLTTDSHEGSNSDLVCRRTRHFSRQAASIRSISAPPDRGSDSAYQSGRQLLSPSRRIGPFDLKRAGPYALWAARLHSHHEAWPKARRSRWQNRLS